MGCKPIKVRLIWQNPFFNGMDFDACQIRTCANCHCLSLKIFYFMQKWCNLQVHCESFKAFCIKTRNKDSRSFKSDTWIVCAPFLSHSTEVSFGVHGWCHYFNICWQNLFKSLEKYSDERNSRAINYFYGRNYILCKKVLCGLWWAIFEAIIRILAFIMPCPK